MLYQIEIFTLLENFPSFSLGTSKYEVPPL